MTAADDLRSSASAGLEWLLQQPTPRLLDEAWRMRRRHFADHIGCAAPSAKRYDTSYFHNCPNCFVHVSVTGEACALRCEHCQGFLLKGMIPARTPEELWRLGEGLRHRGGQGILVSGGADVDGRVPLLPFLDVLADLKKTGLKVIVHCGLIDRPAALALSEAGVDQVLLDIIGETETICEIYHLDKRPEDYRRSLEVLKETGLSLAPHVVIGLHRGQVRGEYEALRHISEVGVDRLVLVVLSPLPGTPLESTSVPPEEAARVFAVARLLNPRTPISLGCARPAGALRIQLERLAIDAGANSIAYPSEQAVEHARDRKLEVRFHELCCSL